MNKRRDPTFSSHSNKQQKPHVITRRQSQDNMVKSRGMTKTITSSVIPPGSGAATATSNTTRNCATTKTTTTTSNATTRSSGHHMSTSNKLLFKITIMVLALYFVMSWWILFHNNGGGQDSNYTGDILLLDSYTTANSTKKGSITVGGSSNSSSSASSNSYNDHGSFNGNGDDATTHYPYPLMAFLEPIHQEEWSIKPLPVRNTTSSMLQQRTFDRIACSTLPQQWPTDEEEAPTNQDPFLPWIHDVFPTADGKFIQFVAQNKRRCQSGSTKTSIKDFMQPNIALFQHVPVTRIYNDSDSSIRSSSNSNSNSNIRYRLSSHQEADKDGIETRFICRFKPSLEETLSVHNLNYDYHTLRKAYRATFTKEGFDNHMIWTSQLLFKCPVPESLQEQVRLGTTVVDDYATLFVDVVPIRTPPRYGSPTRYLPPRLYSEKNDWDPAVEWGSSHILPRIEDSGRWENIPICKPSLMTYPDQGVFHAMDREGIAAHDEQVAEMAQNNKKKRLIACTWTSSLFETRGGKTKVNDGNQRLLQWLEFNKLVGVEHVYVYDNSGAFSGTNSLKSVTDLFPGFATRIDWPAKVCNNRPGNTDNKGERSSQYAAAMSCHLRFGVHSDWLMAADTDEYMVPMGEHDSLKDLLEIADKENTKVLNWKSKRSKPRLQYFNVTPSSPECKVQKCFDPSLPEGKTFLEVYNCNVEKPPRVNVMPAEKAIYRPDFVVLFFVHYATVTVLSQMGKADLENSGKKWLRRYKVTSLRYVDEETEGTMLHTKAIVEKEVRFWNRTIQLNPKNTKLGVEWPGGMDENQNPMFRTVIHGASYRPNCYPVPKIEEVWVPRLTTALGNRSLEGSDNQLI